MVVADLALRYLIVEKRVTIYPFDSKVFTEGPKTVPFDGHNTARFWSLSTYFETTFAGVFVRLVDWLDRSTSVASYSTHCERIDDA